MALQHRTQQAAPGRSTGPRRTVTDEDWVFAPEQSRRNTFELNRSPSPRPHRAGNAPFDDVVEVKEGRARSMKVYRFHTLNVSAPRFLVIHELVEDEHNGSVGPRLLFLDEPKRENRSAPWKGTNPIESIETHLDENPGVVFVAYRKYWRKNESPKEHIDIVSHELKDAMDSLEEFHSDNLEDWDHEAYLTAPYLQMYHSKDILTKELSPGGTTLQESDKKLVGLLFDYIKGRFGSDWREAEELFERGVTTRAHIPKLFGSNEIVIRSLNGEVQAYECKPACTDSPILGVQTWSWVHAGAWYGTSFPVTVDWPEGNENESEVAITGLSVYPLKYDKSGLEEKFWKRGLRFWECRKTQLVHCSEPAKNPVPLIQEEQARAAKVVNPRYIIDFQAYDRHQHSQYQNRFSEFRAYLSQEEMDKPEPPDRRFAMLLPATVPGFSLHEKIWKNLEVEKLEPVVWDEQKFERLVMKQEKKDLLKALVTGHDKNTDTFTTNIITGRGKHLTILLHGDEGTGKTLAAEAVAEAAHKPFYKFRCVDLGGNPQEIKTILENVFKEAGDWGAVLLFDDADMFLEERHPHTQRQNAIVEVFLQALDYHNGIVILTSNTLRLYDWGVRARIHFSIHFLQLNDSMRRHIWRNFCDTLRDKVEGFEYDEMLEKLHVLAAHKINGTQIGNIVNAARQLARFKGEDLGYVHFEPAIRTEVGFSKHIDQCHVHSHTLQKEESDLFE